MKLIGTVKKGKQIYTIENYRVSRIETFDTYRHEFTLVTDYLWLDRRFEIISPKPVLELSDLECYGFAPVELAQLPIWKPINESHCYEVLARKNFNGEILYSNIDGTELVVGNINNGHSHVVKIKSNDFGIKGTCDCGHLQFNNALCQHLAYASVKVHFEQMEVAA